jgi:hypothetical protein
MVYQSFAGYMKNCSAKKDIAAARKVIQLFSQIKFVNVSERLFAMAKTAEPALGEFLIKVLLEGDTSILSSDAALAAFLKKLGENGLERLYFTALLYRIRAISNTQDIVPFVKMVKSIPSLSESNLDTIYHSLDALLNVANTGDINAAITIFQERPKAVVCVKAAHLYALAVLKSEKLRPQFTKVYSSLAPQKFPSETDPQYIHMLISGLFEVQINRDETEFVIKLFAPVPAYLDALVSETLRITTARQTAEWNNLIAGTAKVKSKALNDIIVEKCVQLKNPLKALEQLSSMLESTEWIDCFGSLAEQVTEIIDSQKPKSLFGKLFRR